MHKTFIAILGILLCLNTATASTQDDVCLKLTRAADALRQVRDGQISQPRATAECFVQSLTNIPDNDADADTWLRYLSEGADFLRSMYNKVAKGSAAQKSYLQSEIRARIIYRQRLAELIRKSEGQSNASAINNFRNVYAISVDEESNAIWNKAFIEDEGLRELDATMVDLDPMYVVDQTATRWLDAVRTCPQWVPDKVKAVPDYKSIWCPANCSDNFDKLSDKLADWMKAQSQSSKHVTAKRFEKMRSEIAKYCTQ